MSLAAAPAVESPAPRSVGQSAVRSRQVQVMRGIACLLLVFFHVVGGGASDGLRVSDDTVLRKVMDLLLYIRMPIFGFLSGYVYALKPMRQGQAAPFLKGKARRLVLPLVAVSTLFFLVWNGWYGSLGAALPDMWRIYLFSYEIYWFLQAMVLIFVLVAMLESLGALSRWQGVALAAAVAFIAGHPLETTTFLSLGGALYLLPYFLAGLATFRFNLASRPALLTGVAAFVSIALVIHGWRVAHLPHEVVAARVTVLSLIIGAGGSLLLLRSVPDNVFLARIGSASFAIFLFHIFFVVAARTALGKLGAPLAMQITAGLAAGLAGPMLLEAVLMRWAGTRRVFLGLR
ncbi:acyltransferase [Caulobacter segnis]|uniref:acyltransferase family protein n=1 Tax=Caulobacter segnis TaxID=88688 RepID=UPI00240ED61E|nr:acyltransferase [Caulobacter segnis]MDG2520302.1 acyltransferase [Caulobacter segnis]